MGKDQRMGGAGIQCETIGCGREAYVISGRTGRLACRRCHEETDLALPHVTWRERRRAKRSRITADQSVQGALGDDLEQISNGGLVPTSWARRNLDDFRPSSWRAARAAWRRVSRR